MPIRVTKADRSIEPYLHTKVLGTFHTALSCADQSNLYTAEQLAEAVTFYLYSHKKNQTVTSDEIYLMIQAVLKDTGFKPASEVLHDHRVGRKLQRKRIEVISQIQGNGSYVNGWSKSKIVEDLIRKQQISPSIARAIAGSVEEKVLKMGVCRVSKKLITELVLADTDAMLRAEQQLQEAC